VRESEREEEKEEKRNFVEILKKNKLLYKKH